MVYCVFSKVDCIHVHSFEELSDIRPSKLSPALIPKDGVVKVMRGRGREGRKERDREGEIEGGGKEGRGTREREGEREGERREGEREGGREGEGEKERQAESKS